MFKISRWWHRCTREPVQRAKLLWVVARDAAAVPAPPEQLARLSNVFADVKIVLYQVTHENVRPETHVESVRQRHSLLCDASVYAISLFPGSVFFPAHLAGRYVRAREDEVAVYHSAELNAIAIKTACVALLP